MKTKYLILFIPFFLACNQTTQQNGQRVNEVEQSHTIDTASFRIKETEKKYLEIAAAKYELSDRAGAIVAYSKAIDINPKNPETYFKRGFAKSYLEDNRGAIADYNKVIELKPDYFDVYFDLACSEEALNDYESAMKNYNKSIKNGNGYGYFHRGCLKAVLEDYRGAIEDFNIQLKGNPSHIQTYMSRADAKMKLGDKSGACLDWSKAGELGNNNAYSFIKKHCNK